MVEALHHHSLDKFTNRRELATTKEVYEFVTLGNPFMQSMHEYGEYQLVVLQMVGGNAPELDLPPNQVRLAWFIAKDFDVLEFGPKVYYSIRGCLRDGRARAETMGELAPVLSNEQQRSLHTAVRNAKVPLPANPWVRRLRARRKP